MGKVGSTQFKLVRAHTAGGYHDLHPGTVELDNSRSLRKNKIFDKTGSLLVLFLIHVFEKFCKSQEDVRS